VIGAEAPNGGGALALDDQPVTVDLALLDEHIRTANLALAQATSVDNIIKIYRYASTLEGHIRSVRAGLDAQQRAGEVRVRAQRAAGLYLVRLLAALTATHSHRTTPRQILPAGFAAEHGISRSEAKIWCALARVPQADFDALLRELVARDREVTTLPFRQLAQRLRPPEVRAGLRRAATSEQVARLVAARDALRRAPRLHTATERRLVREILHVATELLEHSEEPG
jgi:hypothetical protein